MSKEITMINDSNKPIIINNETVLEKSPALSFSHLQRRVTLNQLRLLSFSILNVSKDGLTAKFTKSEFEKIYGVRYSKQAFDKDSDVLMGTIIKFSKQFLTDEDNDKGTLIKGVMIPNFHYKDGIITAYFNDNEELELQKLLIEFGKKFLQVDLTITKKFKHSDSWILYEFLKSNFGSRKRYLKEKVLSVSEIHDLFKFDKPTYLKNFRNIIDKVLKVAKEEINEYTEINLEFEPVKKGNKYDHVIFRWTIDNTGYGATTAQIEYFKDLLKELKALSKHELFASNSEVKAFVEEFDNVDFKTITKEQMNAYITSLNRETKILNSERFKGAGSIDFEDPDIINEVHEKVLSNLSKNFSRAIVDIYGYNQFELALEKAKTKMVKANSSDSVADYVSQVIGTIIYENTIKIELDKQDEEETGVNRIFDPNEEGGIFGVDEKQTDIFDYLEE